MQKNIFTFFPQREFDKSVVNFDNSIRPCDYYNGNTIRKDTSRGNFRGKTSLADFERERTSTLHEEPTTTDVRHEEIPRPVKAVKRPVLVLEICKTCAHSERICA